MEPEQQIISVFDRLIPKEPVQFFGIPSDKNKNIFVTITSRPEVWQNDMVIAERIFSEMIICPFKDYTNHTIAHTIIKDVLQQRMKYPNIKENPDLLKIAKTWVLPNRIHMGPDASQFLTTESGPLVILSPLFEKINTDKIISYLKIEVDEGIERALVYSILDAGFRPGLFCVKWTHDVDEHIHTAHCVGHMINCGYRLIKAENGYSLYYFTDDNLYDTCSVKDYTMYNPFIKNISDVLNERYQEDVRQYLTGLGLAKKTETENNSETKVDEGSSGSIN